MRVGTTFRFTFKLVWNDMKKKSIRDLRDEIASLENPRWDKRVMDLCKQILKEREPRILALEKELEELRASKPAKKPRWPIDTPENVLAACKKYWAGTTEDRVYRIHMWNDKAVWTSYPSGGYSNQGWHPAPARYFLIPLENTGAWGTREFKEFTGRVTTNQLREELDKVS